ncbi:hepatic sodium/bile acid cotransporter [Chaetodon trifascialis]|uniref:hepatic sodium/bile acid cotransporter n=1 Tax=Chaetodon trifascialis TaxID=109706 RepID=UPI00399521BD
MNTTADLFSDPDSWHNESVLFNETAANSTSAYPAVISPMVEKTTHILLIVILIIAMVALGCSMEVSKIMNHIINPKGMAVACLAQYGVMPFTAFCLAKAFQLSEIKAVVVLICGCCPGGSLSNILTLPLQGDINLSITMTCCSTLLALGMMPLLLFLYCQAFPNLQEHVPYLNIIASLFLLLIPCSAGIFINRCMPQWAKTIKNVGLTIVGVGILVMAILYCAGSGGTILRVLSPSLMAIAALMPHIGYTFGYIISAVFKYNESQRRTVAIEAGCQNVQLCITIVKIAFPPEMTGPLFLFPIVYVIMQLIEALVLIVAFRCYRRFALKAKEAYQPGNPEDGRGP